MSYNPTLILDLAETILTFGNNNLHWAYVVVTVVIDEETSEQTESATIEASELHIDPLQYWESDGKIYYKIGYFGPVMDGKREAYLLWNNFKQEPYGILVTQTAHGFTFGNTIKRNGAGAWIKSKADTRANAGTVGIVSEIIDADHFRYITRGLLPGTFVDGADYWLSTTTAGEIFIQSDPEVWEIGNVREFIGTGTANGLEVEIDLGDEITEFDLGGENALKNFLELTDTPDSYEGQGGKAVTVNPDRSGLIFTTPFTPPSGVGFEAVKRIMGTQSNTYPEGIQTSPLIGIRQNNQITIIVQHVVENVWTTVDSAIVEVLMSYREFEPELPQSYYLYPIVRPSGVGISDIYLTESDGTFYLNVSLVSVEKWSLDAIARYGPISLSNA